MGERGGQKRGRKQSNRRSPHSNPTPEPRLTLALLSAHCATNSDARGARVMDLSPEGPEAERETAVRGSPVISVSPFPCSGPWASCVVF